MRTSLLVGLALLAAVAAVPSAHAAPASLRFDFPTMPLPADGIVPVSVTLRVDDFTCQEPRDFTVALFANATAGVKAEWALTSVAFPVAPHAYFVDSYEVTQSVNLTVRALQAGDVELTATFAAEQDRCWAPDGFGPAQTTVLLRVDPAQPPPPPPPQEPTPPPAGPTPPPGTEPTSPTPGPAEPTPTTPTSSGFKGPVCSPDGNCGAIGEYSPPPAESAVAEAPGLGLVGAVVAIGAGAFVLRRRVRKS